MASTFRNIRGDGILIVPTAASLPATARAGDLATDASTSDIYVYDGTTWQLKTAGSSGVASFNTRTGIVVSANGDYTASQITNVPAGNIAATDVQGAINELDTEKQAVIAGNNDRLIVKNNSGVVECKEEFQITASSGLRLDVDIDVDNFGGGDSLHNNLTEFRPSVNSPNDSWNVHFDQVNIDPDSDGFSFGTNGNAVFVNAANIQHVGTSNTGSLNFTSNYINIGNGTDPVTVEGFGYAFGFGNVNANATIDGSIQGYGFQPNINAAATLTTSAPINAFYDASNIGTTTQGYTSANLSPTIANVANNTNVTSINLNTNIAAFTGNSGYNGLAINGTCGTMNANSSWQGININPTIASARYAAGINVSMDAVTAYPGVQSSLVEQDLTFTWILPGDNNSYTLQYTPGATAGSEVVSISGNAIECQIEDGVSTATQIKTAFEANMGFAANITITVSGTASDPQNIFGPTNFANGVNVGNVKAAYLDGDVEITGTLSFGGSLSVGKLNAFATQALVDGGGQPTSIHSLITSPTVAANATLTSGDLISVNTAALINIGDNATVGTSFIGVASLGPPAVLTMGTGSTIDRVYGALFALSLDAAATGGTADEVGLCKAVAIPNGTTTVNKLYGYLFDLPFGDPGTTTWGFYDRPGKNNYFAGNLLIGGTAGSDDTVTNSSVALEIKSTTKAFVNARMTTTERNALTAVNGMQIYNTTDDKLQVYAAGSWVDLH